MLTPDFVPIAFSGLEPSKFESFPKLTTSWGSTRSLKTNTCASWVVIGQYCSTTSLVTCHTASLTKSVSVQWKPLGRTITVVTH